MLFNKKIRFSVSETQIKEEFYAEDKTPILRVNIRAPQITCPKTDCLIKTAVPFYKNLAQGFYDYCKNSLAPMAEKSYKESPADFNPYSAVILWENTLTTEDYLSILLRISISNGKATSATELKTQVWRRSDGKKCWLSDFLPKSNLQALSKQYPALTKKSYGLNLFVLRLQGIEVFDKDFNSNIIEQNVKIA